MDMAEMARADAEVRDMMETTQERMRAVERLIEARKQRAKALEMQAESQRRGQEIGSSRDGMGGATSRQGDTVVLGKSDDRWSADHARGSAPEGRSPDTPWWPMASSTPYLFPLSERGEMSRPLSPDQRLVEVQPRGCPHSKCPQYLYPSIRKATTGMTS